MSLLIFFSIKQRERGVRQLFFLLLFLRPSSNRNSDFLLANRMRFAFLKIIINESKLIEYSVS